jgi:hypothetical protein
LARAEAAIGQLAMEAETILCGPMRPPTHRAMKMHDGWVLPCLDQLALFIYNVLPLPRQRRGMTSGQLSVISGQKIIEQLLVLKKTAQMQSNIFLSKTRSPSS